MSASTIEWTDATWNPVTGCTRVSPGCANCYIERTPPFRMQGRRFEMVGQESTTGVTLHPDRLEQPLRWRKPRRVFVCSLADLFHDDVPDHFIASVFRTIGLSPAHTFQVLTKRPERALEFLRDRRWRQFGHSPHMGGAPCFPIIPGEHRVDEYEDGALVVRWWRPAERGEPGHRGGKNHSESIGSEWDGRYLGSYRPHRRGDLIRVARG